MTGQLTTDSVSFTSEDEILLVGLLTLVIVMSLLSTIAFMLWRRKKLVLTKRQSSRVVFDLVSDDEPMDRIRSSSLVRSEVDVDVESTFEAPGIEVHVGGARSQTCGRSRSRSEVRHVFV